jgi:hypothetical protein
MQGNGEITVVQAPVTGSPQQIYRGLQSQREVLGDQMASAQRLRSQLLSQLSESRQTGATRASLEKRILNVDERIASLDKQIAATDAAVATAAAQPGATYRPPPPPQPAIDSDVVGVLGVMFLLVVALPISIAYARRIWRRSAKTEVTLPPQVVERMEALEQGMEAIALEVERIGEGQRFVTQALSERREARPLYAGEVEQVPGVRGEKADARR